MRAANSWTPLSADFDFWFNHNLFYPGLDFLIVLGMVRDWMVDGRVNKVYLYALPPLILVQSLAIYAWRSIPATRSSHGEKRNIAAALMCSACTVCGISAEGHYVEHPNSYKRVATSFASLKEFFGTEPVSLIDGGRVEAYKTWRIKEHEVRPITLRHDLHALSKFFGYAIKQRWTRENAVREVDIPSDADAVRMHILTAAEEKEYFKRAQKSKNLHDCGRLILNQGDRPDEAVCLRKVDVDLERGTLRISFGKTPAARRALNLTSESRLILGRRMAGPSPWIFPKSKKRPQHHVKRLNSAHDRLCAKAEEDGITFTFVLYDFRHTFATRAAQAGIDLATLASILGHSSLRAVHKYVHPTAEHKKAAMLRFERAMKAEERKQNRATRPN